MSKILIPPKSPKSNTCMRKSLSDFAYMVSISSRTVIFFSLVKFNVVPLVVKYFIILHLNCCRKEKFYSMTLKERSVCTTDF